MCGPLGHVGGGCECTPCAPLATGLTALIQESVNTQKREGQDGGLREKREWDTQGREETGEKEKNSNTVTFCSSGKAQIRGSHETMGGKPGGGVKGY